MMEDLAYRRLLDAYYLGERPLNGCVSDVARSVGMVEHLEAVGYVLSKFFTATENGFLNIRCEREIAKWNARGWFPSEGPQLRQPIDEWKETRIRIFQRDGYVCRYCCQTHRHLECDHFIPVSRGGSNDDANLVTACRPCNRKKSNKMPDQIEGVL